MNQSDFEKKLHNVGKRAEEYKQTIIDYFKDMDMEVKKWNFSVGKVDGVYEVEVQLKLAIKP